MPISLTDLLDISDLHQTFRQNYPENSSRLNLFLATCIHLDEREGDFFELQPLEIVVDCPYGGLIGIGNSRLEHIFNRYKIFRLHAALHDACGYMKSRRDLGPGYIYAIPCCLNSCFLGHITGLGYCAFIKFFRARLYERFAV